MKTIVGCWLLALSLPLVYGQGQVQFRNYYAGTSPAVEAAIFLNQVGGTPLNGQNPFWRAALLGGLPGSTPARIDIGKGTTQAGSLSMTSYPLNPQLTWVNFASGGTHPLMDGYFSPTIRNSRVIPGVNWGQNALVQVVAWQGNYDTWIDAYNAALADPSVLVGASDPLIVRLPESSIDPHLAYLCGLESFAIHSIAGLSSVPEPDPIALIALGSAALFLLRRGK